MASKIFENAILSLHKRNKTILLILSQYRFVKYATQILLLKQGTLIENKEEVSDFIVNSSSFNEKNHDTEKEQPAENFNMRVLPKENDIFKSSNFDDKSINSPINYEKDDDVNTEMNSDEKKLGLLNDETKITILSEMKNNQNEEIREEGEIKIKTLNVYIKGMGIIFFSLILFTITMMQVCKNFYDIWLKEYVNYNTIFLFDNNFQLTLIIIAIFTIFWTLIRAFSFAISNLKASKNIFIKLLHSIIYSKMSFFESNAIGRIINRFSGDTQAIDDRISFESNILLNNIFSLIGSMTVIIMQNVYVFISNFYSIIFYFNKILNRYHHYWDFVLFYSKSI